MKAAIFDMDGTLIDSMHMWKNFHKRVIARLKLCSYPDDIADLVKYMSIEDSANYFSNLCENKTKEDIKEIYYDIQKQFYENEAVLKPNVAEFLQQLYEKKIAMCVATETNAIFAKIALKRTGILKYFKFVICSEEIGRGKNYPDIFFKAIEKLDIRAEEAIIFEDSYYAAQTAKKAGFKVCAVYDSFHSNTEEIMKIADKYINDYCEYEF